MITYGNAKIGSSLAKGARLLRMTMVLGGVLAAAPLLAQNEPLGSNSQVYLEQLLQDPNVEMSLENTRTGIVLHIESSVVSSRQDARDFAIELLKQKNLIQSKWRANGYGLPE